MKTVLLDASNLAMRSFHAAKHAMSAYGEHTGTLVLFVNALAMHCSIEQPDRFLACWDSGGSSFRESIFPAYKQARRDAHPQGSGDAKFGLVKEFLQLNGLAQCEREGIEADDLIASAHTWTRKQGDEVTILSADKDLLQLVDAATVQVRFSGGAAKTDRWDRERMVTELGYGPERVPLVMALTGDTSDGIPGVPGIGPKRAVKLLEANDWDLVSVMNKLPDQAVTIDLSLRLVELRPTHVPGPLIEVPPWSPVSSYHQSERPGLAAVLDFCDRYQLKTIKDRLEQHTLWW